MGLSVPPEKAFRPNPNPSVKDGWFYECWMDEKYSEQVLRFQRTSRDAFVEELSKRYRLRRAALSPLRPFATRALMSASPYIGRSAIAAGATLWEDVCRVYELPIQVAHARTSAPAPPSPFVDDQDYSDVRSLVSTAAVNDGRK
jgi:hypothetical protein